MDTEKFKQLYEELLSDYENVSLRLVGMRLSNWNFDTINKEIETRVNPKMDSYRERFDALIPISYVGCDLKDSLLAAYGIH